MKLGITRQNLCGPFHSHLSENEDTHNNSSISELPQYFLYPRCKVYVRNASKIDLSFDV